MNTFTSHQTALIRSALIAEVTALAYAVRAVDINQVGARLAAVVECLGGQIALAISPADRSRVLEITKDVTQLVAASRTQMSMDSNDEADVALQDARDCVDNATAELDNFVRGAAETPSFKAMFDSRENYNASASNYLRGVYWLGEPARERASGTANAASAGTDPMNAPSQRQPEHQHLQCPVVDVEVASTQIENADTHHDLASVLGEGEGTQNSIVPAALKMVDESRMCPQKRPHSDELTCTSEAAKRTREKVPAEVSGDMENGSSDDTADGNADDTGFYSDKSLSSDESGSDEDYEPASSNRSVEGGDDVENNIVPDRIFRKRVSKQEPLAVWTDLADSEHPRTVHVYQSDLNSLQADASLTQTALDYFIYRYSVHETGQVCVCESEMYALMETARYTRLPKKRLRLIHELGEVFDWTSYKYVLLPVSGRNHWSFLVVENPIHADPTKVYHVNSMKSAHSSAYAFDVLQWFLGKIHGTQSNLTAEFEWSTFVHYTKPQQTSCSDCGIYVLHYTNLIAKNIPSEKPHSIEDKIAAWTSGSFNASKATAYRSQLYKSLLPK